MRWDDFTAACPPLATAATARLTRDQLVLLGTIRLDGAARISPCECDFTGGDLLFGMMWRSRKALDLLRDPRVTVHSLPADKDNKDGDIKLDGRVVEVLEPAARERFCAAIEARIQWHPTGDYHLFALDVERAATLRYGDPEGMLLSRWRVGGELTTERRPD